MLYFSVPVSLSFTISEVILLAVVRLTGNVYFLLYYMGLTASVTLHIEFINDLIDSNKTLLI